MKIGHLLEFVEGDFDMDSGRMVCVCFRKKAEVQLCFEGDLNVPFARIRLHSRDRYVDAVQVMDGAYALGGEIARRWNALGGVSETAQRALDELAVTRGMLDAAGKLIDALQVEGATLRGQLATANKRDDEMQDAVERLRTELADTRKDYGRAVARLGEMQD